MALVKASDDSDEPRNQTTRTIGADMRITKMRG